MASDEFEYDVALSFAGEDRTNAENFAQLLKAKGIKVFYDEYEAAELWGKDLIDHLVNIYSRKARYCVMLISQYYPLKKWTRVERMAAQERAFRDANEYILPIRLDDTQVPGITETTGYRDLRQHPMEDVVNLLEEKLMKSKGRTRLPSTSHDLRSGSVSSANTQPGAIPMPPIKKTFTQLQKDRFAREAFDFTKHYFQQALKQLEDHDGDIQTDFTEVTNLKFTSRIYVREEIKCQCMIWLGNELMPNTIYYNEGRVSSGHNSFTDYLTIEDNGEELRLRISGMNIGVRVAEDLVNKEKGAEYFWNQLISHLEYR